MSYKYLQKEAYKQKQNANDFDIDKEYQSRLNGPSTFSTPLFPVLTDKTKLQEDDRPIFFVETTSIIQKSNEIIKNSSRIKSLESVLPGVAKQSYTNSLLVDEIKYTNEIEGIETHRSELGTMVGEVQNESIKKSTSQKRLISTVKLYNDILTKPIRQINDYQDLRDIYDTLTNGEISSDKQPDGEYFRNGRVYIGGVSNETHVPPVNESKIKPKIKSLIDFMNNDNYPEIEKAIVTHFMFENIHPFYDGNGRTGRYLLSQYLSNKIDVFSALSLSKTIRDNEAKYYKIFQEAEIYNNYGELTFFIEEFMNIIIESQKNVIDKLNNLTEVLSDTISSILEKTKIDFQDNEKNIIFIFVQSKIFTSNKTLGIKDTELIDMLYKEDPTTYKKRGTKRFIQKLEEIGLLTSISSNPLQHEISDQYL